LGTVAEVLTMCCFFDKYWRGVGSYDLLSAVAKILSHAIKKPGIRPVFLWL
jgi:hypothetical protein